MRPCDGLTLLRNAGAATCSCRPPLGEFRAAPAPPLSWPRANLTALQYVDRAGIILRVWPVWRPLKSFEKDCYKVSASKGGEDAGDDCECEKPPGVHLGPSQVVVLAAQDERSSEKRDVVVPLPRSAFARDNMETEQLFAEHQAPNPSWRPARVAAGENDVAVACAPHAAFSKKSLAETFPSVASMILHITGGSGTRPSMYRVMENCLTPI
jgi:hypothetical protein